MTLAARLRLRREEIEHTVLARVHAVDDATGGDPEYALGLRTAVAAALGYGLACMEREYPLSGPVPPALLAQARQAARFGVSLDTVLRRYFAGHTLLCDFLLQEVNHEDLSGAEGLRYALRAEAGLFDGLVVAVSDAYTQEIQDRHRTAEHRRAEQVKRLLAGELLDTGTLSYELGAWHLGLIAGGPGAPRALRELAAELDRRLLMVRPGGETVWAWLGSARAVDAELIVSHFCERGEVVLAIGEPGRGLEGWRLTHRQAKAAFPIATRRGAGVVGYREVALVASVLENEVLAGSLVDLYLAPLGGERDGGETLRRTLRAYFAAGRNAASAAAVLGVSRQTVAARLQMAEERIGRPLNSCAVEVETALRLKDVEASKPPAPLEGN